MATKKDKMASDDAIVLEVPEDLTALSDEQLAELKATAMEALDQLEDASSNEEVALLEEIVADIEKIDAEISQRAEVVDANKAKAAELLARIKPQAAEAEDSTDEDTEDSFESEEASDADDDADEDEDVLSGEVVTEAERIAAESAERQPVVAANTPPRRNGPVSVPRLKARQKQNLPVPVKAKPFHASATLSDRPAGAEMDYRDVSMAFAKAMESARTGAVMAARQSGGRFSQRHTIASITKPFAPEAIVVVSGGR